jgi:hypothetical protein
MPVPQLTLKEFVTLVPSYDFALVQPSDTEFRNVFT